MFEVPISMAIAFSLLAAVWIYPEAPRLLAAIGGAAALIPAVLVLRRLVDRHLFPVLNAMVLFYFTDQLRSVLATSPVLARFLFLGEMLGGALFLAWLLRSKGVKALRQENARVARNTVAGARVALAVFLAAFLANSAGCAGLGLLLGNAALGSGYLAVVLYAAIRIADGLILGPDQVRFVQHQQHRRQMGCGFHMFSRQAVFISGVLGGIHHPQQHIRIGQGGGRHIIHIFTQLVMRLVNAGGVHEDDLVGFSADNAQLAPARCLGAGRDRSDFLIHDCV